MKKGWNYLFICVLVGLIAALGLAHMSPSSRQITLTVAAAADLHDVLPEIGKLWEQETGQRVRFHFGSTGQLAQQIERGAPVDLFAAANKKFIEDLEQKGLIFADTKALYGIGRITLWQRQGSTLPIRNIQDLTQPHIKRIAIAHPDHAPYGVAAREALQSAGIWEHIQPKIVFGENVRQTQQYAETGNVDVAIVALSISVNRPGIWTLIPPHFHRPLEQVLAVPKSAPHPTQARQLAHFINSEKGRILMRQYGFVLPGEKPMSIGQSKNPSP
jgi:molybdate transport system substrate-binding protein